MLKFLLLALHERATHEVVASAISDIIEHVGTTGPYRGGRLLLQLLEFALREAEEAGDRPSASGLQDALGYAKGTMLERDLRERYVMYNGSGQDEIAMIERTVSALHGLAAAETKEFLSRKSDASVEDLQEHFEQLAKRAIRFVRLRKEGHYGAYRIRTDIAAWLVEVITDRVEIASPDEAGRTSEFSRRLSELLSSSNAEALSIAAQTIIRRQRIDHARTLVENPHCSEEALRKALSGSWWIFGGQYVGEATHRRLTPGLEIDIPLLGPNGILHVVELKRAQVKLIKQHRANYVATAEVNDAVGQVLNYLRMLDERRDELMRTCQVDSRRARGTVVIGHPMYSPEFEERQICETLRNYSSHLNRVDIVTYKEILDSAERSLTLSEPILPEDLPS